MARIKLIWRWGKKRIKPYPWDHRMPRSYVTIVSPFLSCVCVCCMFSLSLSLSLSLTHTHTHTQLPSLSLSLSLARSLAHSFPAYPSISALSISQKLRAEMHEALSKLGYICSSLDAATGRCSSSCMCAQLKKTRRRQVGLTYLRARWSHALLHALPCTHVSAQNGSDTGALGAVQPILRPIPETASLTNDPLPLKMSGCVLVSACVHERDESISVRVGATLVCAHPNCTQIDRQNIVVSWHMESRTTTHTHASS